MAEETCHRCGVTIDTDDDAYYQRIPPDLDLTDPLFFCSARCVYEYTGQHKE